MWQKVKNLFEEWRYQLFYFTFYAGYMPLLVYLPVYLRHVGLSSVQVGIINGIRPVLQSLVTPLLIIVGEKLRSNRLLFVVSCFVAIAKILIMYLLIRPQRQLCIMDYVNRSHVTVLNVNRLVHVSLEQQLNGRNKRVVKTDFNRIMPTLVSDENFDSDRETRKLNSSEKILKRSSIYGYRRGEFRDVKTRSSKKNEILKDTRLTYQIRYSQGEVYRIFISLVFLTLLADPFIASIYTLVDYSCTANMDKEHAYKEVRFWETLGWGIMTPIIGLISYEMSSMMCGLMVETFHYIFYFFIAFIIIVLLIGLQIDFTKTIPEVISKKVQSARSNLQYGIFSIAAAFAGFGHGFLLTFANWFIDTLGGTTAIMGLATASKSVIDIMLYLTLGRLIEQLGYVFTISLCLVGHIFVFLIYYGITNPWLVILAEALYGIVYGSLMTTAASFLVNVAPAGSNTRMQAIFHGIYWAVGMFAGCTLAGYRIDTTGFPTTFLTFACITAFITVMFLAVQFHMLLQEEGDSFDDSISSDSLDSELNDWSGVRLIKADDDEEKGFR